MAHNVIPVVVQVVQHSAVMVQPVSVIMNVKRIIHPQKRASAKQMVRHVQMGCVRVVFVKMTPVQVVHQNHARLI